MSLRDDHEEVFLKHAYLKGKELFEETVAKLEKLIMSGEASARKFAVQPAGPTQEDKAVAVAMALQFRAAGFEVTRIDSAKPVYLVELR